MEETKDMTNNIKEETQQEKKQNNGGFFGFFFSKNKGNDEVPAVTETNTEQSTSANPEVKTETDKITIKVEPSIPAATSSNPITTPASSSTTKPIRLNEINLYDDEPSLKDIPLDIYDDSIKLQPQNLKNAIYHSNESSKIDTNLNYVNLYETPPEPNKTIFRKIKEIFMETIRLIKVAINAIFAFIWALIGGTITAIFVFFRRLFFNMLCSCIKFMFKANTNKDKKKGIVEGISDAKNMWDINHMIITKPIKYMV